MVFLYGFTIRALVAGSFLSCITRSSKDIGHWSQAGAGCRYLKRQWLRLALSGGGSLEAECGVALRGREGFHEWSRSTVSSQIGTSRRRPPARHDRFGQAGPMVRKI